MSNFFSPYEGKEPFIFISYAHADADKVIPIIKNIHDRKYRVWYDTGIEVGSNWPEVIANHLSRASMVLFFVSKKFSQSQNCMREVNFAVDAKIPMISIYLEETDLPHGLKMQLSTSITVKCEDLSNADYFIEELIFKGALKDNLIGDGKEGYETTIKKKRKKLNLGIVFGIVGVLMSLASFTLLFGVTQGWFSNKTTIETKANSTNNYQETTKIEITTWTNSIMRDIQIRQANNQALYACGKAFMNDKSAITYSKGKYLVAGNEMSRGDIDNLELFAKKNMLLELSLCYQNIKSVSPLKSLTQLQYLDLSGNNIDDISTLKDLSKLSTLKISRTNVTDLSATKYMQSLEKLYISYNMVEYAKNILDSRFEVIITE